MRHVHIDIETRSSKDLKSHGLMNYAHDPSTRILCICFKYRGKMYVNAVEKLLELSQDPEVIFCAHNASFEFVMLHALIDGFVVPINRWRCSASIAAYHRLPRSLGAASKCLGLDKQKDEEGKKIMLKMCKPLPARQQKENRVDDHVALVLSDTFGCDYTDKSYHLTQESYYNLGEYCEDDVLTEEAIIDRLGFLPDSEQELWECDFYINWFNGVPVDLELCQAAIELFDQIKEKWNNWCMREHGFKLTQTAKIAEFLGTEKADAATLRDYETDDEEKLKVIQGRQIVGNTTPTKFKAILNMAHGDCIYGMFIYHAAGTGRWSSRGVQMQNLARGELSEGWEGEEMDLFCEYLKNGTYKELMKNNLVKDEITLLKTVLRGVFVGNLAVCDYSSIEARVLPWLAGDDALLEEFRQGRDFYKVTAAQIYRKPYEEITKDERFIGKIASLALGYQGGSKAFISFAEAFGVKDITEEFAEGIKNGWRKSNKLITKFWYDLENGALQALKSGEGYVNDKVHFKYEDDFLKLYLPSGRPLHFYKPEITTNTMFNREGITFVKEIGPTDFPVRNSTVRVPGSMPFGRIFTSPGKLAENCTQAVARDLLADAMLKLPKESVSMHIHDEIVAQDVPLKLVERAMLDKPDWAEGLPVDVDGFTGTRYRK